MQIDQSKFSVTGAVIRSLMRKHGVTIASITEQYNLTKKRVREVRIKGATGFNANEWHKMITGHWLDEGDNLVDQGSKENC